MNEMKIVVAACILHNICIRHDDETELSDEHEEQNEDQDEDNVILEAAINKRNRIADILWANRR